MILDVKFFFITFFSALILIRCAENVSEQEGNNVSIKDVGNEKSVNITPFNVGYEVVSIELPQDLNFAGEMVPVNNLLVSESLDKEFTSNAYWHSNTIFYIKRSKRWFPIIEPILEKNSIPDDFKYLAVIESGLLNVTSPSGAKGYWQFMEKTALGYGLEISNDVDERKNMVLATEAACKYLKEAYNKFGNWTLAATSYNMGKTGLMNKLKQQKVDNYYDLLLNAETARYVYRMIAVKYILSNPQAFGINVKDGDGYVQFETYSLKIDSSVSNWVDFAIKQHTSYKTFRTLNPWITNSSLNNINGKVYEVLLPAENKGLDVVGTTNGKFLEP